MQRHQQLLVMHWTIRGALEHARDGRQGEVFPLRGFQSTWLTILRQVAQNLGLSRLGAELAPDVTPDQIRAKFGSRWTLAADREVGRRIWFALVEQDVSFAPEHNFTYLIHPSMNKSVTPTNIEDEELVGAGPIANKPAEHHTVGVEVRSQSICRPDTALLRPCPFTCHALASSIRCEN